MFDLWFLKRNRIVCIWGNSKPYFNSVLWPWLWTFPNGLAWASPFGGKGETVSFLFLYVTRPHLHRFLGGWRWGRKACPFSSAMSSCRGLCRNLVLGGSAFSGWPRATASRWKGSGLWWGTAHSPPTRAVFRPEHRNVRPCSVASPSSGTHDLAHSFVPSFNNCFLWADPTLGIMWELW